MPDVSGRLAVVCVPLAPRAAHCGRGGAQLWRADADHVRTGGRNATVERRRSHRPRPRTPSPRPGTPPILPASADRLHARTAIGRRVGRRATTDPTGFAGSHATGVTASYTSGHEDTNVPSDAPWRLLRDVPWRRLAAAYRLFAGPGAGDARAARGALPSDVRELREDRPGDAVQGDYGERADRDGSVCHPID